MYNFAASESVCDDTDSLMSLRGRSTECTVHNVSVNMHHICIYMYKRIIPMFIICADNNGVEDLFRMCMILPIRNFYVDRGKKRKTREIELYRRCVMKREIFIYWNVYIGIRRGMLRDTNENTVCIRFFLSTY